MPRNYGTQKLEIQFLAMETKGLKILSDYFATFHHVLHWPQDSPLDD
jgi:hypothetical protein